MKRIVIILILITTNTLPSIAQKNERSVSYCTPESAQAKLSVELFVSAPHQSDLRSESGALNESVDKIAVVDDELACTALMNLINNKSKYKNINDNLSLEETIFFYQTENFYYVSWGKKPEFYVPRMGPKKIFLVVRKDLSQLWEFYK